MSANGSIGFFDSGLGGLGVLAAAIMQLPRESFIYLGDNANAPYGTKTDEEVLRLTQNAAARLTDLGIKALVIACNTATGAAVEALRRQYSFPIIGLEPALKLAEETREEGTVLVMATPLALTSKKYLTLYEKFGQHAINVPCPGLMEFVENEEVGSQRLDEYLVHLFEPYQGQQIDSVVLGCTHYLFLRQAIQKHFHANTRIIDSNDGVVRQLIRKLSEFDLLSSNKNAGTVTLISTGGPEKEAQMHRMINQALNNQGA